jgi:predicted ATP-grasp superfamily ATP-dependent carboligase
MKYKVFITDAADRISLSIARSLGKKGIEVTAGDSTGLSLTRFSKYCARFVKYPSPKEKPEEFLAWMRGHLKTNKYDVLLPVDDIPLLIISKNKEELSRYCRIPIADIGTVMKARNKKQTLEIAIANGIDCPRTCFVENLSQLQDVANNIAYPALIKPQESSGARGIVTVKNKEELISKYLEVHDLYRWPLVQELIPSPLEKYCASYLFDEKGKCIASFLQNTIRQFNGADSYSIGIYDESILEFGERLLKLLRWRGVALVEFVRDLRDGRFKLLEINPRFWSSLELAIVSGVDFPYLLYRMAIENSIEKQVDYDPGVMFNWLFPADLLVRAGMGYRFKKGDYNANTKRRVFPVFSFDDTKPIFAFSASILHSFIKRKWL